MRKISYRRREDSAPSNLGTAYGLGETRRAIERYEQDLVVARKIGDSRGQGIALGNLGNAYADLGESRRAIEMFEQLLVIARGIGDRHHEVLALGNLGITYAKLAIPRTRRCEYAGLC